MENLIVVSVDSHAQAPPEAWPEYLEPRYHEYLPSLHEENEAYTTVMGSLAHRVVGTPDALAVYDKERRYRDGGFRGIWDADLRLEEMDREGIAGEFAYHGDHRATAIFHNVFNRKYDLEVCEAGVRAYHRWAADTFGAARDRIFLVAAGSAGIDMGATLAELEWISDHGFRGTYAPGFISYPGIPPLFDEYWEPVWTLCEERGLPLFIHAGFGSQQGLLFPLVERIKAELDAAGSAVEQAVERIRKEVFTTDFFADVKPRRPMWQLMLGGVFDRHPNLRLVMTEVRADWMPATLRYLDAVYELHRADLPATRMPTEYWHSNCLTSLSFVHRAEVEMRHELGIETLAFGRDSRPYDSRRKTYEPPEAGSSAASSAVTRPSEIASSPPRIQASMPRPPPIADRMNGMVMNGPMPTMSIMFSAIPRHRPMSRLSSFIAAPSVSCRL